MAIGIDPTVDYAFKVMLGNPRHPGITLHFLNAILGPEKERYDSSTFDEVAEVLEVIKRTPDQRRQYERRIKAQRDEEARLQHARQEGEARGKLIGQIETLEGLLGEPIDSLDSLSLEKLTTKADILQRRLRERGV